MAAQQVFTAAKDSNNDRPQELRQESGVSAPDRDETINSELTPVRLLLGLSRPAPNRDQPSLADGSAPPSPVNGAIVTGATAKLDSCDEPIPPGLHSGNNFNGSGPPSHDRETPASLSTLIKRKK